MQTTHKVQGSDAGKYATYLTSTSERGDYYIDPADERGEGAAGEWHGNPTVLASLGLSPDSVVQRDQLLALMNSQASVTTSDSTPTTSHSGYARKGREPRRAIARDADWRERSVRNVA